MASRVRVSVMCFPTGAMIARGFDTCACTSVPGSVYIDVLILYKWIPPKTRIPDNTRRIRDSSTRIATDKEESC